MKKIKYMIVELTKESIVKLYEKVKDEPKGTLVTIDINGVIK